MCVNCVTHTEVLAISFAGATTAALELRRVISDALRGRPAYERKRERWEADVAFISSLGMDPVEVLGPPPMAPAPRPASVRAPGRLPVLRPAPLLM
jgi:hypothetical protein